MLLIIRHPRGMKPNYLPNENYFQISWSDLETAWRMLASPDRQHHIEDMLQTIQTLSKSIGPEKAVYNMVAATAWLTDDGPVSHDG